MTTRVWAVVGALALGGCGTTCINGSIDLHGRCGPAEATSECVMKNPGDRCLDTGTCNVKAECEIPGGAPNTLSPRAPDGPPAGRKGAQ